MTAYRVREFFNDGALSLTAVESLDLHTSRSNVGSYISGSIDPVAIIVSDQTGTYALDIHAQTLTLEQLRRAIPELDALCEEEQ